MKEETRILVTYRLERARESLEEADILLNPCWPFNRGGNVPHYYFKSILLIALKT
jgi:hypothetical protein